MPVDRDLHASTDLKTALGLCSPSELCPCIVPMASKVVDSWYKLRPDWMTGFDTLRKGWFESRSHFEKFVVLQIPKWAKASTELKEQLASDGDFLSENPRLREIIDLSTHNEATWLRVVRDLQSKGTNLLGLMAHMRLWFEFMPQSLKDKILTEVTTEYLERTKHGPSAFNPRRVSDLLFNSAVRPDLIINEKIAEGASVSEAFSHYLLIVRRHFKESGFHDLSLDDIRKISLEIHTLLSDFSIDHVDWMGSPLSSRFLPHSSDIDLKLSGVMRISQDFKRALQEWESPFAKRLRTLLMGISPRPSGRSSYETMAEHDLISVVNPEETAIMHMTIGSPFLRVYDDRVSLMVPGPPLFDRATETGLRLKEYKLWNVE